MLALFTLASLEPLIGVFAVLAIVYVLITYVIPLPANIKTGVLYIIGIVVLVYVIYWAIHVLGGS